MMNSFVLVREILIEDYQRPALNEIKIRNGTLDPRLQACYDCHVRRKTAVLMMMNGFVLVKEILIEDYQRPALI